MQESKKSQLNRDSFDILLFDSFSNHCLANFVEPLRAANGMSRTAGYHWRFLTMDGAPVTSSSGLQVAPHGALKDGHGHMLVVMPSYGYQRFDGLDVTRTLKAATKRYANIAGLDTGSWLLARAGLLDGHRATIHWEELDAFAEAFPEVRSERSRFVIDGNRITCSGAMAAFDLVLHLVSEGHGPMLALEVAQLFMSRESARSHTRQGRRTNRLVDRAIAVMQENLEAPLAIGDIAARIGCSQKTLETRVDDALGVTPQAAYRRFRLNNARKLVVETDLSVLEIAGRCGYLNASAMTRAFKAQFETTPKQLRRG